MTKTITWSETVVMAADVDEWNSIPSSTFISLIGKSRHGKNRVHQHGNRWRVTGDGTFKGQPAWQLVSCHPTDKGIHDERWVLKQDDPDFIIRKP